MLLSGKFEIPLGNCQGILFPPECGNPDRDYSVLAVNYVKGDVISMHSHYENLPMQYTKNFFSSKN